MRASCVNVTNMKEIGRGEGESVLVPTEREKNCLAQLVLRLQVIAKGEACAFPHAFCSQLRHRVASLEDENTLYSVCTVLSTKQMLVFPSKDPG